MFVEPAVLLGSTCSSALFRFDFVFDSFGLATNTVCLICTCMVELAHRRAGDVRSLAASPSETHTGCLSLHPSILPACLLACRVVPFLDQSIFGLIHSWSNLFLVSCILIIIIL